MKFQKKNFENFWFRTRPSPHEISKKKFWKFLVPDAAESSWNFKNFFCKIFGSGLGRFLMKFQKIFFLNFGFRTRPSPHEISKFFFFKFLVPDSAESSWNFKKKISKIFGSGRGRVLMKFQKKNFEIFWFRTRPNPHEISKIFFVKFLVPDSAESSWNFKNFFFKILGSGLGRVLKKFQKFFF
jgi:hypothetical protein